MINKISTAARAVYFPAAMPCRFSANHADNLKAEVTEGYRSPRGSQPHQGLTVWRDGHFLVASGSTTASAQDLTAARWIFLLITSGLLDAGSGATTRFIVSGAVNKRTARTRPQTSLLGCRGNANKATINEGLDRSRAEIGPRPTITTPCIKHGIGCRPYWASRNPTPTLLVDPRNHGCRCRASCRGASLPITGDARGAIL